MAEKRRLSFTIDQRREAYENTDRFFKQKDLADRLAREEKTRGLRAARLAQASLEHDEASCRKEKPV